MIKKNAISQKCNNQTCLKFILLTSSDPLGKQTFLNCSPAQKCLMRFYTERAFFSSFIIRGAQLNLGGSMVTATVMLVTTMVRSAFATKSLLLSLQYDCTLELFE